MEGRRRNRFPTAAGGGKFDIPLRDRKTAVKFCSGAPVECLMGEQMTPAQFESEVARRFPALANEVEEDQGLLHVVMGHLDRYVQKNIASGQWNEVDRVFRFLDEAYGASRPSTEIENAIRVSFLEYFEFQGHEAEVRRLLGPTLTHLYDDQMRYMEDLARRATK
jgi:hypothetical protein